MPDPFDALRQVNRNVNARSRYQPDPAGQDEWGIAWDKGDCEDFATLKMELLKGMGVQAPMRMGVFWRPGDGKAQPAWHAVLLVDGEDGRRYALDNLEDEPYEWKGQATSEWEPHPQGWLMSRVGGTDWSHYGVVRQNPFKSTVAGPQ